MAHEFESGFFVEKPAWHGLGTLLQSAPATAEEAIKEAGLDWFVMKTPLTTTITTPTKELIVQVPEHFSITRERFNDGIPYYDSLGCVGQKYQTVQNLDCFKFFDKIIQGGEAEYHTAGSLYKGRIIWILAKVHGPLKITKDDYVEKFLLLYNSHDGSTGVETQFSPIRVVCANTLSAARSVVNKDFQIKIRHTKNVVERMTSASEYIELVNYEFNKTAEKYHVLAGKGINVAQLSEYLEDIFPDPAAKVPKKALEKRAEELGVSPSRVLPEQVTDLVQVNNTRTQNIRDNVINLFENGLSEQIKTPKTYWRAYNAVVEYIDYHRQARDDDRRLRSAWLGQGMQLKTKALDIALDTAA